MVKLILRSLVFYWRSHLSVLGGTALACGVLTGALLVGDSVDYSLRTVATARLGGIHYAMDTRGQFVQGDLAANMRDVLDTEIASALHLKGVAIHQDDLGEEREQVNKVEVYGVDSELREPVGSSASNSRGRLMSARTTATRCRPPTTGSMRSTATWSTPTAS